MKLLRGWNRLELRMTQVPIPASHIDKIRVHQLTSFKQLLPYGLIASAANALVVLAYFFNASTGPFIWAWAGMITAASAIRARAGFKAARRTQTRTSLPTGALKRPVQQAALQGCVWALAPMVLLPLSSAWQTSIMLTVCAGIMAGGAYMLSTIPRAAAAFVSSIALGVLIGLLRGGLSAPEFGFIALLLTYTLIMVRSAYWNYGNYVRSWLQQIQLTEQAREVKRQKDVISLLLKDFEESASDYLWEMDADGCIQDASQALAELCQIPAVMLNGTPFSELIGQGTGRDDGHINTIKHNVLGQRGFANVLVPVDINGEERWWNMTGKPRLENGKFLGYRGVISDVTDARVAEARIVYLEYFDALTALPNRAFFTATMERCLYHHKADGEAFAVIHLDLDFFKTVNETHGHEVGDELLKRIAAILNQCVEPSDTVARMAGDEFAIISRNVSSKRKVMALCDSIVCALGESIEIDGQAIQISASLGAALCPHDADTLPGILKCTDLALYQAKADGKGRARFFEPSMDRDARQRRKLEKELHTAFTEGQFALHYQPLVDSHTKEVKAFETLLRWNHPERGQVSPEAFISLTEQTGMIVGIGEWVIRTALAEAATWDTDASISINLSPIQVKSSRLVPIVTQALAASGIAPNRVEFEITETVLLDDSAESMDRLHRLRQLGVKIALDDFGTGYSSLSYLRAFPFDKIKIDKSFVQAMNDSLECRAIVRAVASLATSLGMTSTAEGVETIEQADELTLDGCTELQGFYFSHPKSGSDLIKDGFVHLRKPATPSQPEAHPTLPTPLGKRSNSG